MPEHFCYLLRSASTKDKAYIGYTIAPPKRLLQHNGVLAGGAKPTQRHRPWELVAVVGGFRTKRDALCFEYAWQHPRTPLLFMRSVLQRKGLWVGKTAYVMLRRLTLHLPRGSGGIAWHTRVLSIMLGMPVWENLYICADM
jgi:predicted GIY-YIG superfamily endonuclease